MTHCWGRPAAEPGDGWAVIDVETSGFHPRQARVISIAALALDAEGRVEHSVASLLNPGVDPGPTHVHGLTTEMLEDQPTFAEIADDLVEVLRVARWSRTTRHSTTDSWPPKPRPWTSNCPSTR